uniref:Uncharacterized protein n=1 Tax=Cryptomonas curvata TaxID=233186 RepID=A0A7S0M997_9CRYP
MLATKLEEDRERFEAEMARIVEDQEKKKSELRVRQEQERLRFEEEIAKEGKEYEERLRTEQERRMEELKRKKEEIEKIINNDAENLSKEERSKMIEQHELKLRQLEQEEVSKKAAMDSDLEEKLARRRKKKQEQIDAIKAREAEADKEKMQSNSDSLKQMMRIRKLTALADMARQGLGDEAVLLCQQMHSEELEALRVQHSSAFARAMASMPADSSPEHVSAEEERLRKAQQLERVAVQGRHAEQMTKLVAQVAAASAGIRGAEKSLLTEIKSKMDAEKAKRMKAIQEEHEDFERQERAKIEANMANLLVEMEAQRLREHEELSAKRQAVTSRANRRRLDESASSGDGSRSSPPNSPSNRGGLEPNSQVFGAILTSEREKQEQILQARLEMRRQQKLEAARAESDRLLQQELEKARRQAGLEDTSESAEDRAQTKLRSVVSRLWTFARLNTPVKRAANKWMLKALGRGLWQPLGCTIFGVSHRVLRTAANPRQEPSSAFRRTQYMRNWHSRGRSDNGGEELSFESDAGRSDAGDLTAALQQTKTEAVAAQRELEILRQLVERLERERLRSRARPRARSGLNRTEMEEMLRSGTVAVDLKQQLSKVERYLELLLKQKNLPLPVVQAPGAGAEGPLKRRGSIAERRRSSVVPPLDLGGGMGSLGILEESPEAPADVPAGGGGEAFELAVSRGQLGSLRF